MKISRGLKAVVMSAAVMGAAVAMAGPATAESLEGTYFVAAEQLQNGGFTWVFTSCGPDCVTEEPGNQLLRQGNSWVGTTNAGCATTIDGSSLAGTYQCPMLPPIPVQLTKVS
jgi:hypothetical protein